MKIASFFLFSTLIGPILLSSLIAQAQISPPGLGNANTASWIAIGVRQRLDTANHKQSVTYVGVGRISNPDDENPFKKSAIIVINEEFYNQFHKHWQYSVALSYRRQNEYEDVAPYEKQSNGNGLKQEFRVYGRFSYILRTKNWKLVSTYRQEFRKFYTSSFKDWEENYQLRSRFRVQLTRSLDRNKKHNLVASAEALFSISKESNKEWTDWDYHESRFCFYYSFIPLKSSLVVSIGYMNNLIGKYGSLSDAHYMALDIIWNDPFGNLKKKKVVPDATLN